MSEPLATARGLPFEAFEMASELCHVGEDRGTYRTYEDSGQYFLVIVRPRPYGGPGAWELHRWFPNDGVWMRLREVYPPGMPSDLVLPPT
jgi:hypothetical protein